MVKKLLRFRVIAPLFLLLLGGVYWWHERVAWERDRRVMDIMIKDTTLPLDILILRRTGMTADGHVKDRRVIRDEAFFSTAASPADASKAIEEFAKKHGIWDESWINWAVFQNRSNNGRNRPNAPDDFQTLIWIAVDTNEDWF